MAEAQLVRSCSLGQAVSCFVAPHVQNSVAQRARLSPKIRRSDAAQAAGSPQHCSHIPLQTSSFTSSSSHILNPKSSCKAPIARRGGRRGPRCALELLDSLHEIGTHVGQLPQVIEGLASAGTLQGVPAELLQTGAHAIREFQALPQEQQYKLAGGAGGGWLYLTARPGVFAGAIDAYLFAPLQYALDVARGRRRYKRTDFVLGNRIGEGSFGTVYEGALVGDKIDTDDDLGSRGVRLNELEKGRFKKVVLKKVKIGVEGAEECGEMEEWFNRRMQRYAPGMCAEYLGSFIADKTKGQFSKGGRWLVWNYQSDASLLDYMKDRDFPYNLERPLFGKKLTKYESVRRQSLVIKKVARQMFLGLKKLHRTGIVHRDIKPANYIITDRGRVKLIDFGAATDLRVGKNYTPNRGILDPDYCPPEQYVLPETTPAAPSAPLAALASPILWRFSHPDLFDTYSAGIVMLQMAIPTLRTDLGLGSFKKELESVGHDLRKWRETTRLRADFSVLDQDGGQGWDLVCKLVCPRGPLFKGRLSAPEALRHPYFLLGSDQLATISARFSKS